VRTPCAEGYIGSATPLTKSDENIKLIRAWIDKCQTDHVVCRALEVTRIRHRQLPSRLLKIEQGEIHLQVKLCDSAQFDPEVQYATLSHTWGRCTHLKLTYENIEELKQGIPISKLPQTFKDAVELTHSLSLRYLWIDSLCIIQDIFDKSDWEQECPKMCGIYIGALISIAATAAVDSDGGLFTFRNLMAITPCLVYMRNGTWGTQRKLCALWVEEHQMRSFLANTPLNQRAWWYQERLLAPRTVHFTDSKIVWECPRIIATETDPYNDVETLDMSYFKRGNLALNDLSDIAANVWAWTHAVEVYSSGHLTYESDKLVAISGIAKYLSSKVNADPPLEYLAGLWNHDLAVNLLWCSDEPENVRSRPQQYRAPSWSWAAINGHVRLARRYDHRHHQVVIERAETCPISDPFGAVISGYIRTRGNLCAATLRGLYPTCGFTLTPTASDIMPYKLAFDDGDPGEPVSSGTDTIYLLEIICTGFASNSIIYGVVLSPARNQRGRYSRIAYFMVRTTSSMLLHDASQESRLAETLYLESHNDHTYTIEII
jgi:Heterokaryon incompatibility protein (HET)